MGQKKRFRDGFAAVSKAVSGWFRRFRFAGKKRFQAQFRVGSETAFETAVSRIWTVSVLLLA